MLNQRTVRWIVWTVDEWYNTGETAISAHQWTFWHKVAESPTNGFSVHLTWDDPHQSCCPFFQTSKANTENDNFTQKNAQKIETSIHHWQYSIIIQKWQQLVQCWCSVDSDPLSNRKLLLLLPPNVCPMLSLRFFFDCFVKIIQNR